MGNSTAKAREVADETKDEVNTLIEALENKLQAFQLEIKSTRGGEENNFEVAGGRTVMRISEVRVSTGTGMDNDIKVALESFFKVAQNAVGDDAAATKASAVKGAQNMVTTGLSALFGTAAGQGMTKRSFAVLFLNNAFCRVDIYAYSFNVNASKWGAKDSTAGACYIADLSVLKTETLEPSEINFFLSQALSVRNGELGSINRLKIALIQSAILSRALKKSDITLEEVNAIAVELAESQKVVSEAFRTLDNYLPHDDDDLEVGDDDDEE